MDFLSRLIGANGTPNRKSSTSNSPQQRLARFKKIYNHALQAYNRTQLANNDPSTSDAVRVSFQRLTNLLQDDTRAPAPHLCLSFASSYQVYSGLAAIAVSLKNKDVIREAVAIYSVLVDSDEEALLENETFARELMRFIKNLTDGRLVRLGREAEGEVLELAFSIAAKIRLEPDLLPVWFRPSQNTALGTGNSTKTAFDNDAFPLCYQFVENVYNEGRAGDFARTGLLYIFESATHYNGLEGWIVNSDLPTMMASGLGALYSQLSRKISIAHPDDRLPLILALSDNDIHQVSGEADSFYSENLQSRLSTFMSNLVFWQDILEHCRSLEIKQTLIDHFQVFFLQQILYPSLLESSDIDGGSSVAVLTYLWRILDSVDHPDLIHLILKYLLAVEDSFTAARPGSGTKSSEQRKASMRQRLEDRGGDDTLNPSFFNLIDLINASVRSTNVETVTAALRLVGVILNKHHQHAISSLVRSVPFRSSNLNRTFGSLRHDLEAYVEIAESIGGVDGMNEAYENCLKDGATLVETHVCSSSKIGLDTTSAVDLKRRGAILDNRPRDLHDHLLLPDDPLIHSLMDLMRTFFTNDIETNLGLTDVISHLATCPYTRLEGWLVVDPPVSPTAPSATVTEALQTTDAEQGKTGPSKSDENPQSSSLDPSAQNVAEPEGPNEDSRIAAFKLSARKPTLTPEQEPRFVRILRDLDTQLQDVKATIVEMNHFISGRKRAFQGATELENETRSSAPSIVSPKIGNTRENSRTRGDARGRDPGELMKSSRDHSPVSSSSKSRDSSLRPRGVGKLNPAELERRAKSPLKNVIAVDGSQEEVSQENEPEQHADHQELTETDQKLGKGDQEQKKEEQEEEEEIFERLLTFTRRPETLTGPTTAQTSGDKQEHDKGSNGNKPLPETTSPRRSKLDRSRSSKASLEAASKKRSKKSLDAVTASSSTLEEAPQAVRDDLESTQPEQKQEQQKATLNHVLTNVVILQEFILEIAAIIQVRSSLLDGEVRFV